MIAATRAGVRPLLGVAAGGVGAALLWLGLYALRGDLGVFVYSLVQLPLELEGSFYAPWINFWPVGQLTPELRANAPLYLPLRRSRPCRSGSWPRTRTGNRS